MQTQWFVYVDDDTYVLHEPLLDLLSRYDPRAAHYFGRPLQAAQPTVIAPTMTTRTMTTLTIAYTYHGCTYHDHAYCVRCRRRAGPSSSAAAQASCSRAP